MACTIKYCKQAFPPSAPTVKKWLVFKRVFLLNNVCYLCPVFLNPAEVPFFSRNVELDLPKR